MTNQTKPTVDMGCTIRIGSDTYAATVVAVSPTGAKVTVQYDRIVSRLDDNGNCGPQEYEHAIDPNGERLVFFRGGNRTHGYQCRGRRLTFGERRSYRDPSF